MAYSVKELFYSLQGEGAQAGSPAVFCRFSGCNLWSGHERDRPTATCNFCDTDFVGVDGSFGGRYKAATDLADTVRRLWPAAAPTQPLVICTGGEPLLQLDDSLIAALHRSGFRIAVETNGTREVPPGIDWVCVSPKSASNLVARAGDELKLVYPQPTVEPAAFEHLQFTHWFLQPMDGPDLDRNTRMAVEYCLDHPLWRLSLQIHKILSIR